MLSTTAAAQLPSSWYCIPSHLNVHHHAQQKRKHTTLSLANADSQISLRNFNGLSLPKTHNCSKGQESNNRGRYNSNLNQNHKHLLFLQFCDSDTEDTNNQNPRTGNHYPHQVDKQRKFKENNKVRLLFTNMWWVHVKAAIGQRINLEGILCSIMVIFEDPKLALAHISILVDIRYIDWAELLERDLRLSIAVGVAMRRDRGHDCEVLEGLYKCIDRLSKNDEFVDHVHDELPIYKRAGDMFGYPAVVRKRTGRRDVSIHSKKRSRLEHQKLQKLVYVKYNQALQERYESHDLIDPIVLNDIDDSNGWIVGELDGDGEYVEDKLVFDDDVLTWRDVASATGMAEPLKYTRRQT
ncbi:hypothetical protein CR513_44397, partial [Mucuna pruriens]